MYRIQYILFRVFRAILLFFPEKTRFGIVSFLGSMAYKLLKKRREIALINLKMVFPEKTDDEREKIAKKSFITMVKAYTSALWFDKYLKNNVELVNYENLKKLYSENRGVVVALIHMGNMEASLKTAEDLDIITVAKVQKNPYLDGFITKIRSGLKIRLLKKSKKTPRELKEAIEERKGVVALFSDHRDKGATVNFLGTETISPTGAVSTALKYDMPLIVGYNIMKEDNSCVSYFTNVIELDKSGVFKENVKVNTQKLMDVIGEIIKKHPEQWLWAHDRWNLYRKMKKGEL